MTTGSRSQFGLLLRAPVTVLVHYRHNAETDFPIENDQSKSQSRTNSQTRSNSSPRCRPESRAESQSQSQLHLQKSSAPASSETTPPQSASPDLSLKNILPSGFLRLKEALHALVDEQLSDLDDFELISSTKLGPFHRAVTVDTGEVSAVELSMRLAEAHSWIDSLTLDADYEVVSSLKDALDDLKVSVNESDKEESHSPSSILYVTNDVDHDERQLLLELVHSHSSDEPLLNLKIISFNASRAAASRLRSLAKELGANFHVHTDARLALSHGVLCEEERAGDANEEVYLIWEEVEVKLFGRVHLRDAIQTAGHRK